MSENRTPDIPRDLSQLLLDERSGALGDASLIRELVDLHRFTENILRNMGSGLIAINGQGVITHFNEQAAAITGYPAAGAVGQACDEVFRTADEGPGPLRRALTTTFDEGEIDLVTADGRTIPVALRLTPLEQEGGHPAGAVAIFDDLSDSKRAEAELRRKDRMASLGELSAGVAHEIRNPLAGIGAAAQILKKRMGPEDERTRFTDIILEEVARLDRIVDSLLRFARPAPPRLAEGSVPDCVERVFVLCGDRAHELGVTFDRNFDPAVPRLYLDADQIVQVLLNVVQNSLQAMPNGGTVTVSVQSTRKIPWVRRALGRRASDRTAPPGSSRLVDYVEITVRDTGHGIPRDALDRIFDPFFTTRREGTGLGLSISQAIVREHGGFMHIESQVGKGAAVIINLPVEKRRGPRRRA